MTSGAADKFIGVGARAEHGSEAQISGFGGYCEYTDELPRGTTRQCDDSGFSLVELLLVIVILGILATAIVLSVGGMTGEASESSCDADAYVLYTATEAFFAQRDTEVIPAADETPDAYERTLVTEGFMRGVSELHDVDKAGQLAPAAGSPCIV